MRTEEVIELLRFYSEHIGDYYKQGMKSAVNQIEVALAELDTLQMNYNLLEEKFDGSAEEKVDKLTEKVFELTEKLERQEKIKKDMRHVAYEEGYIQGYAQAKFDIEMDKTNEGEV